MIEQIKFIVKGYILWIWYYLYKPYREKRKADAKKRIEICESCEYFYKPARNCAVCGCFMDVKTKMPLELDEEGKSIDGCLMRKW